jgi:hypothetical protein
LPIISQFNDNDDEYLSHSKSRQGASEKLAVIGITVSFWPEFVPIVRRLRSVTKPTLDLISRAKMSDRGRDRSRS